MKITASQISAFRLARHHLANKERTGLVSICRDVCGIQAQMMSAAELAFWTRMHEVTRRDIRSALWKSRTLVKTSMMRQTLHIIPSNDFPLYIAALKRSRVDALMRYMSKFGITMKELDALNEYVLEFLRDGPMSQSELTKHLLPRLGSNVRRYMKVAWGIQLFRPALVEGLICCAPQRGKEAAYARVDHWLPKHKTISEDSAKKELVRRYLTAYGPATPRDFSKWSGVPMKEVREAWEPLRDELVEVSVEEKQHFMLRRDMKSLSKSKLREPILRLLPSFDPYLLGHAEKNHLVEHRHYKRVYRSQGWLSPVVLLNGKAIGIWSYKRRGNGLFLEITSFARFSRRIRAKIEKEAESLGEFLETTCQISYAR